MPTYSPRHDNSKRASGVLSKMTYFEGKMRMCVLGVPLEAGPVEEYHDEERNQKRSNAYPIAG
jgi:hypothetical protein